MAYYSYRSSSLRNLVVFHFGIEDKISCKLINWDCHGKKGKLILKWSEMHGTSKIIVIDIGGSNIVDHSTSLHVINVNIWFPDLRNEVRFSHHSNLLCMNCDCEQCFSSAWSLVVYFLHARWSMFRCKYSRLNQCLPHPLIPLVQSQSLKSMWWDSSLSYQPWWSTVMLWNKRSVTPYDKSILFVFSTRLVVEIPIWLCYKTLRDVKLCILLCAFSKQLARNSHNLWRRMCAMHWNWCWEASCSNMFLFIAFSSHYFWNWESNLV